MILEDRSLHDGHTKHAPPKSQPEGVTLPDMDGSCSHLTCRKPGPWSKDRLVSGAASPSGCCRAIRSPGAMTRMLPRVASPAGFCHASASPRAAPRMLLRVPSPPGSLPCNPLPWSGVPHAAAGCIPSWLLPCAPRPFARRPARARGLHPLPWTCPPCCPNRDKASAGAAAGSFPAGTSGQIARPVRKGCAGALRLLRGCRDRRPPRSTPAGGRTSA